MDMVFQSSIQSIIKRNNITFVQSHLEHNLLGDDLYRRVEFCSRIIEFNELDSHWHTRIVFSD